MSERTYHQYCPIAHALDLVGDRWTLLIVRDLILGPKRFTDLQAGLPGIGTNILTTRLKGLEQAGVVQRRVLPPPAASTVYELTPYGRTLEATVQALAVWGSTSLGAPQPEQVISIDSVLLMIQALGRQLLHQDVPARCAVQIDDARLQAVFEVEGDQAGVHVRREPLPGPKATLRTNLATLAALAGGTLRFSDAVATGAVQLDGMLRDVTH